MKKDYRSTYENAKKLLDKMTALNEKIEALRAEGRGIIEELDSTTPIICSTSDKMETIVSRFKTFEKIISMNLDFNFNGELADSEHTARILTYGNKFAIEILTYYDHGHDYGYTKSIIGIYDTLDEAEDRFIGLMLLNDIVFTGTYYKNKY